MKSGLAQNRQTWLTFRIIRLMHDHPLLPVLRNPHARLRAAGLQPGQRVLEVGCGPGFYTLPAAEIVGPSGRVYATDVNPWAIRHVKEKIARRGFANVQPMQVNAAASGLPAGIIDLAFVFGLPRVAGGLENLTAELGRLLSPGGTVVFGRRPRRISDLAAGMHRAGFVGLDQNRRLLRFQRKNTASGT